MSDDNNTAIDAIQIDEDVLSYTASDEALEGAAGIGRGGVMSTYDISNTLCTAPTAPMMCA